MACQCKWIVYSLFFECIASTQLKIEREKNERNEEFEMNHEATWKEHFSIFPKTNISIESVFVVARSFMIENESSGNHVFLQ